MKYTLTAVIIAYGLVLMAGYMAITAHGRAMRAEALEQATRVSFEGYLRTKGKINPYYTCKVKQ